MDFRDVLIDVERFADSRLDLLVRFVRRDETVGAQERVAVTAAGVGERVGRIQRDRLLEKGDGVVGSTSVPALEGMSSFEIEMISLEIIAVALGRLWRGDAELQSQCADDVGCDLILDCEHVFHLSIEALRPNVIAVDNVDELCRDPELLSRGTDASLEEMVSSPRTPPSPAPL